ncbi:MAG: hypothetical protein NC102_01470 [Clostridium sp.]|nr:hypothetical protein [Clostridium sp.]
MNFLFRKSTKDWFIKNVHVRSFLKPADLQNKWIIDGIKCVVNVSSDQDEEVSHELQKRGIAYYWFPMLEQNEDMGLHSIYGALKVLQTFIDRKDSVIIHCFGGNNRSKVIFESSFYLNFCSWPNDDVNCKTLTNCLTGHLSLINFYQSFIQEVKRGKSLDECLKTIYNA